MKSRMIWSVVLTVVLAILFINKSDLIKQNSPQPSASLHSGTNHEYEKLLLMKKHANPNSPEGIEVAEKLEEIERQKDGNAKPEKPDEFVRILHDGTGLSHKL
jgi:hypothetical protein